MDSKWRWSIDAENFFRGDGSVVATGYFPTECEYPRCTIYSFERSYLIKASNGKVHRIPYHDVILDRIERKLRKKLHKGKITSEEFARAVLAVVCRMAQQKYMAELRGRTL